MKKVTRWLGFLLVLALLPFAFTAKATDINTDTSNTNQKNPPYNPATTKTINVHRLRLAAEQGNAVAQYNLGLAYIHGQGVPQDYKEAAKWARLAAEQGFAPAQSILGAYYREGLGVQQDYKESVKWFRMAAEQGFAAAQSDLGSFYATGQGVKPDHQEAVKWFRLAAEQGDAMAQFNLAIFYGKAAGVKHDYKEALKWFRLAAEQDHTNGLNFKMACTIGWNAQQSGNYSDAIELLNFCIKTGNLSHTSLALTYREIGLTYRAKGEHRKAIDAYNQAIALHPADIENDYINRGNAYDELGLLQEALADYDKALMFKPGFGDAYLNRGIAYEHNHLFEKAKKEFITAYDKGLRSRDLYERFLAHKLFTPFAESLNGINELSNSGIPASSSNPLPPANSINLVWNTITPGCSLANPVSSTYFDRKYTESIQQSKLISLPTLGFKINIPQIPGIKSTDVWITLNDHTRGVTDNYVTFGESGLKESVGAIVITELPSIDATGNALISAALNQGRLIWAAGLSSKLQKIQGPYGDAFELSVKDRKGSGCFPTSDFKFQSSSGEKTIGISRFTVIQNKLVEFSLIIPISPDIKEDKDAIVYARKIMDSFWLALQPY